MQNQGYARFDRETARKLFKDVLAYRIYSLIELNATHSDYEYNGILLKPGQWIRSYSKLAEDLEYKEGRGYKKPDKSTISRAIDRLVDAGVIEVEFPIRVANHATDSATVSATDSATINATLFTLSKTQSHQGFEGNKENINATVNATDKTTVNATDSANKTIINKQSLNKQELNNKYIDDDRQAPNSAANVFQFYEQNGYGTISGHTAQEIGYWIDDLSEELVIEALKRGVEHNGRNWNYVKKILLNWHNKGLKTISAVEADDLQYEMQKQQRMPKGAHQRGQYTSNQQTSKKQQQTGYDIPASSTERKARLLAGE